MTQNKFVIFMPILAAEN